jgi:hypothetical protein
MREMRNEYKLLVGKPEENLGDLSIDRKIIVKRIIQK